MQKLVCAFAFSLITTASFAAEWRYTDGAGKTVKLPDTPSRILAQTNSVAGLLAFGIRPAGAFLDDVVEYEPALRGIDLADIDILSTQWDAIDTEKVLNLNPDLVVTEFWVPTNSYGGSVATEGIMDRVEAIAPIVGVPQNDSILALIESYASLAETLGADLSDPVIARDKADFEAALAAFQAALATKPGLKVMAISPRDEGFAMAVSADSAELSDFTRWGMTMVQPDDEATDYWFNVSWENAANYPADLILVDDRFGPQTMDMLDNPIAQRLPAVAAGQVGWWPAYWVRSYRAYADELAKLTVAIEAANPHIVD